MPGRQQQSPMQPTSPPHIARGVVILCLATFIWGTTFVVVKRALDDFPPGAIVAARFLIAAVVFTPWLRTGTRLWGAAIELGVLLWLGFLTQTIGLRYTSVDRSAFITSLHVIFVPAFAGFLGRRSRRMIWLASAMALLGVGLLSNDGSPPNMGDLWTAACAFVWAIYITRLETFAREFPSLTLTASHLWVVALLSVAWSIGSGETIGAIPWAAMLYLGLAATALTTWLQTMGQRFVSAPQAAVLYTMEPVWAALFAWIILRERLGTLGWTGAILILTAALLTQFPRNTNQRKPEADAPSPF